MDDKNFISAIEKVSKHEKSAGLEIKTDALSTDRAEQFAQALDGVEQRAQDLSVQKTEHIEPIAEKHHENIMDLSRKGVEKPTTVQTLERIEFSAKQVHQQIEEIKQTLQQEGVKIKSSVQHLLDNKATQIDESLQLALKKAGVEYTPPPDGATVGIPTAIEKFLAFLTRSQTQLENVASEVNYIRAKSQQSGTNPADLLAVQLKVQFVQQEMELFTNLMNKGLESTKTLMNTQV